jgi:hypothetical protein
LATRHAFDGYKAASLNIQPFVYGSERALADPITELLQEVFRLESSFCDDHQILYSTYIMINDDFFSRAFRIIVFDPNAVHSLRFAKRRTVCHGCFTIHQ